ncbi:MAG: hypothetical protein AAF770_03815 [Bacteroidota bacterium]
MLQLPKDVPSLLSYPTFWKSLVLKHEWKGDLGKLAKEDEKLLFSMIDQSSYSTQASLYTLSQSNIKK